MVRKFKNYAIILASGKGERSGLNIPKQFVKIAGKTVLEHTVDVFEKHPEINEIIVVTNPDFMELTQNLLQNNNYTKVKKLLAGGVSRRESSYIGVTAIDDDNGNVLIHDAVRPFLQPVIIDECLKALKTYKAVDVAVNSSDTIVKVNDRNIIEEIPDRKYLRCSQTPQAFDLQLIKQAHEKTNPETNITDDCGLVVKSNLAEVFVINGDDLNRKITYPIDIEIAEKLFQFKKTKII